MAFNRSWDTVAETWGAVSTTWDFASDPGVDTLTFGLSELGEVTVFVTSGDTLSVSLSEAASPNVIVEKTSSESIAVSLAETAEVSIYISSSDSITLAISELADELAEELLGAVDSEDFIQFAVVGEVVLGIEDWPQSLGLPPTSWGKAPSADSIWTKVPEAVPSPWN